MVAALLVVGRLLSDLHAQAAVPEECKSSSYVTVSATTKKADVDGKRFVTVVLDIDEKCFVFANPVDHGDFEDFRTKLVIRAQGKSVPATIKYPTGIVQKLYLDEVYKIYKGKVVLEATIDRPTGDPGPLEAAVTVHAELIRGTFCLFPSKIQVPVKSE